MLEIILPPKLVGHPEMGLFLQNVPALHLMKAAVHWQGHPFSFCPRLVRGCFPWVGWTSPRRPLARPLVASRTMAQSMHCVPAEAPAGRGTHERSSDFEQAERRCPRHKATLCSDRSGCQSSRPISRPWAPDTTRLVSGGEAHPSGLDAPVRMPRPASPGGILLS